jgi:hypothetical protein
MGLSYVRVFLFVRLTDVAGTPRAIVAPLTQKDPGTALDTLSASLYLCKCY